MSDCIRLVFDGDDLFTLELALTAYQHFLEQCDDSAFHGQRERSASILRRVEKAAEKIDDWGMM